MEHSSLTVAEVARQYGISSSTLRQWADRGIVSLVKEGRAYYVDGSSLESIQEELKKLSRQQLAVEQLSLEMENAAQACMDSVKEYKLEMMMRKESAQRVNLYMEIFASLTDVIYEGRYDGKEYRTLMMFLKGNSIKEIAEELQIGKSTVVNNIRKANEILFNLQPYTKMMAISREAERKAKLLDLNVQTLRTMLAVCREQGSLALGALAEDDVALMMTPVDALDLSIKTKKALAAGRVNYVGDIVFYGKERLLGINGFGPVSYQEVKAFMAQMNLSMGTRMPAWQYLKKAYGTRDPFIYDRLFNFNFDKETEEYVTTVLEGLPEDRMQEIRELFEGLYAMGERYKHNFTKYKQMNASLREEIVRMKKALKNEDYYLSPSYEEIKRLFQKIEQKNLHKQEVEALENSDGEPAQTALGLVDCIFSQEAYQAESQRMRDDWQKISDLKKKVKKLESQLHEKAYLAQLKAEKTEGERGKEAGRSRAENHEERMAEMEKELEVLRRENRMLESKVSKNETAVTLDRQLKRENEEANKKLKRQELEIKQLKFEKKSRDLTIATLSKVQGCTDEEDVLNLRKELLNSQAELSNLRVELLMQKDNVETIRKMKEEHERLCGELAQLRMERMEMEENKALLFRKMQEEHERLCDELSQMRMERVDDAEESRKLQEEHERLCDELSQMRMERVDDAEESRKMQEEHERFRMDIDFKHRQEIDALWQVLRRYEFQVDSFNGSLFFEKMWKKLKKFSDAKNRTLDKDVLP